MIILSTRQTEDKNPHDYGTPEYKLFKFKNEFEDIIDQVQSLRTSDGEILDVKRINVTGPLYSHPSSYFNTNRTHWRSEKMDKNNRSHVENCYENAVKAITRATAEMEEIHKSNEKAIENNKEVQKTIINFMEKMNIPRSYTTYEYPTKRHRNKKSIRHTAGYIKDLDRNIRTTDGYVSEKAILERKLKEVNEWRNSMIKEIEKNEKEAEKEEAKMRKLAVAMGLAKKYGIESFKTNEELFRLVEKSATAEFIEENKIAEDEAYRVEGNFLEGYYLFNED